MNCFINDTTLLYFNIKIKQKTEEQLISTVLKCIYLFIYFGIFVSSQRPSTDSNGNLGWENESYRVNRVGGVTGDVLSVQTGSLGVCPLRL